MNRILSAVAAALAIAAPACWAQTSPTAATSGGAAGR
jgi:hypothetical protein